MNKLLVNPVYASFLRRAGLTCPTDFLQLTGTICSGHPDRHVVHTSLQGNNQVLNCYIKKEHRVPFKVRVLNASSGFGWVASSLREFSLLQELAKSGIGSPEALAAGENDSGQAFVLLKAIERGADLREFLRECSSPVQRRQLATALGHTLARLHNSGFDHPDLYSKHVWVKANAGSYHFQFLDWQRGRRRKMTWKARCQNLAALHFTLSRELLSSADRLVLLQAYFNFSRLDSSYFPRQKTWIKEILRQGRTLLKKRRIRELLCTSLDIKPTLHWLEGEAFCVTSQFLQEGEGELSHLKEWVYRETDLSEQRTRTSVTTQQGDRRLTVRSASTIFSPGVRHLFEKPYRAPEVNQAGLLFRLQKQCLTTPRLLAFGQKQLRLNRWSSFLLTEVCPNTKSLQSWLKTDSLDAAMPLQLRERWQLFHEMGKTLRQIHDAGCRLGSVDNLGIQIQKGENPRVVVNNLQGMGVIRGFSNFRKKNDVKKVLKILADVGTLSEQMRFLQSYFQKHRAIAQMKKLLVVVRKSATVSR